MQPHGELAMLKPVERAALGTENILVPISGIRSELPGALSRVNSRLGARQSERDSLAFLFEVSAGVTIEKWEDSKYDELILQRNALNEIKTKIPQPDENIEPVKHPFEELPPI